MLIGESKKELEQREHPFKEGDIVVCERESPTTHIGGEYKVINPLTYIHRCRSYEDHWWERNDFITIMNDRGSTIKVNALNFKLKQKEEVMKEYIFFISGEAEDDERITSTSSIIIVTSPSDSLLSDSVLEARRLFAEGIKKKFSMEVALIHQLNLIGVQEVCKNEDGELIAKVKHSNNIERS